MRTVLPKLLQTDKTGNRKMHLSLKIDVLLWTVLPQAVLQFVRSQPRSNKLSEWESSRPAPLQHNQIFFARPFQLIRYQSFYHTMPQNGRNWKRRRLNYKQKSTLAHSITKLRSSPANVLFLIHNLISICTSTVVLPSHNLPSRRTSTLVLPSAGEFTKQMPATQTRLQSGLIKFVS
jgi:hypothetical protein